MHNEENLDRTEVAASQYQGNYLNIQIHIILTSPEVLTS